VSDSGTFAASLLATRLPACAQASMDWHSDLHISETCRFALLLKLSRLAEHKIQVVELAADVVASLSLTRHPVTHKVFVNPDYTLFFTSPDVQHTHFAAVIARWDSRASRWFDVTLATSEDPKPPATDGAVFCRALSFGTHAREINMYKRAARAFPDAVVVDDFRSTQLVPRANCGYVENPTVKHHGVIVYALNNWVVDADVAQSSNPEQGLMLKMSLSGEVAESRQVVEFD
jgi:hypothetical protein